MNNQTNSCSEEAYDSYTFNSKNPLARFAHRTRYKKGLEAITHQKDFRLLDMGCGDGRFLHHLSQTKQSKHLIGFEPFFESNLFEKITIYNTWEAIKKYTKEMGLFDYVVCFEVLEHLNEEKQKELFQRVSEVLKPNGKFIISVPVEKGFPSLVKNIRRATTNGQPHIYCIKNILASFFGFKTFWMKEHRKQKEQLSHLGFFFHDLEQLFKEHFTLQKKPFVLLKV